MTYMHDCPFCGGEPETTEVEVGNKTGYIPICKYCGVFIMTDNPCKNSEDAKDIWNYRVEEVQYTGDMLDCPFCGSTADIDTEKFVWQRDTDRYFAKCTNCGCELHHSVPWDTPDEALKAWNTRN